MAEKWFAHANPERRPDDDAVVCLPEAHCHACRVAVMAALRSGMLPFPEQAEAYLAESSQ